MESNKGKFIVFEGIDGSGKSTQARLLKERLEKNGLEVFHTCEPTNNTIGTIIRDIMTQKMKADEMTIAALFLADRLDHLNNEAYGIVGKLNAGINVISDRYYFSSYAYHSVHVPMEWVIQANSLAAEVLRPDIVFYLDITAEDSLKRIQGSRASTELYEKEENLKKVRENYLRCFDLVGKDENVQVLSAMDAVGDISGAIWAMTEKVMAL